MLEAAGYDPALDRWAAAPDARVGRVLSVERGVATVLTDTGEMRAGYGGKLLGSIAGDANAAPCPGDWAVLRSWPDRRTTLERLAPRRTTLTGLTGAHVVAANVDVVAVVVAADAVETPSLQPLLRLASASGARTVLVLTRCDRIAGTGLADGVQALTVCTRTGRGLEELRALTRPRLTLATVGRPGQGRDDVVRALVGDLALRRSPRRQLHVLPGGGAVIDTPSLRAVA